MSEINNDLNPSENSHDAQLAAEEAASGKGSVANVDVSADYEASKELSVSPIDHTGAGEKAAEAATSPDLKVSAPDTTESKAEPTGDPDDYRNMAKEVSHSNTATGNVSDDLVDKAIDLGKPGQ